VDNSALYTQPEDIWDVYRNLAAVGPYFSIAAGFGNVHGVYKPGNVRLHPELLDKHQKYAREKLNAKEEKPLYEPILFTLIPGSSSSTVAAEVRKRNILRLFLTESSR
jgi:fructose-bisphosphate aldolase, class II